MTEYLSKLPGYSDAEFWSKGNLFGVNVNELELAYTAERTVTMLPGENADVAKGKLYYDTSSQIPIPLGKAKATLVKDATDSSGQPRLYLVFQNGSPTDPEPTNTFAIFEFADTPPPDVVTLTSGIGEWSPRA